MKTPREILLSQHRHVEPKLNRIWHAAVTPRLAGNVMWRELIWPCRRIWLALACAWVLIVVLNLMSTEPAPRVAGTSRRPTREELQALAEQRRMLAQLIGTLPEPVRQRKSSVPQPRSERSVERAMA
jgi:hypothetical protein